MQAITFQNLTEEEIDLIRQIDRGEEIFEFYELEEGNLVVREERIIVTAFNPNELNQMLERQVKILKEGGRIIGAFVHNQLVGVASVENKRRGSKSNFCKMDILYVSMSYRGKRIGQQLIRESKKVGCQFGGEKLYISATPTKNTVDFYLKNGAALVSELDAELYELEPLDIHLELSI